MADGTLLAGFWRRRAGLLVSVAAATAWTVLALSNDGVTYHFAPAIVAALWPVVSRFVARGPLPGRRAARAAIGGAAVALYTTGELWLLDALDGPTLWGSDGAAAESVAFAVAGAALGGWQAAKRRPGLLFTGEDRPREGTGAAGGSRDTTGGSTRD